MITTRVIFDWRGVTKMNPRREGAVTVRITEGRRARYVSTGVKVLRSEWRDGMVVNRPDADILNERVRAVRMRVEGMVSAAISEGRTIDVCSVRGAVTEDAAERPVLDWMAEQVELLNVGAGTRAHYRTMLSRLDEFGQIARWEDVTTANIYAWDAWLRNLKGGREDVIMAGPRSTTAGGLRDGTAEMRIGSGTVYNYHKCLKSLLGRAMKMGKVERSPYLTMRGEFKREDKENVEYLTEDEMAAVEAVETSPGSWAEKARDLFVFQMYTGLSYADTQAFDIAGYRRDGDMWRAVGQRVKTGVPYVSALLPPAVAVLERHGMRPPRLSNQKYNQMLKVIGMMAGVKIPLHSHLARHSFATFAMKHGVAIENLSKMLGHTNVRVTQRYAKVLAESVNRDYDKLNDVLSTAREKPIKNE